MLLHIITGCCINAPFRLLWVMVEIKQCFLTLSQVTVNTTTFLLLQLMSEIKMFLYFFFDNVSYFFLEWFSKLFYFFPTLYLPHGTHFAMCLCCLPGHLKDICMVLNIPVYVVLVNIQPVFGLIFIGSVYTSTLCYYVVPYAKTFFVISFLPLCR